MDQLCAAVVQFDIEPGNVAANEAAVAGYIAEAAAAGAQVVVLPELWNCGYALDLLPETAQDMRGSSVRLLRKLAKEHHIYIFVGSIAEKKDGLYYNTMVVVDWDGNIVAKYRKVHLFSLGLREDQFFTPGDDWVLVDTPWGKAGLTICYDVRFPEFIRNLVLRGARFLVAPAQWPEIRLNNWLVLLQARAVENEVFMLGANRTGRDSSGIYGGGSLIVSPWGNLLAEGKDAAGVSIGNLDFQEIAHAASRIPALQDRRRIMDEIDDGRI